MPLPPEATSMTAADLITFKVSDRLPPNDLPTDNPDVRAFWARIARPEPENGANVAECLVTGQVGPVESSLPGMLKRIPGGQSAGVALISANAVAFESYGWERAQTSPISREAAERFTKALNRLIEGERTHLTIGGLVYVFWTKDGGDDFFSVALNAPEQVRDTISGILSGKRSHTLDTKAFYALALSASGGRAVVRDWLSTTVGNVYHSLKKWYEAQEIVSQEGASGALLGVYQLAGAAYRDRRYGTRRPTEPPSRGSAGGRLSQPTYSPKLFSAAGPSSASHALKLRSSRRALPPIHLSPISKGAISSYVSPGFFSRAILPISAGVCSLNWKSSNAPRWASTNTTLVDRYFGAASTAPATVFGVLLTNANKAHLPKLRKTKTGVYQALQQRIEEIVAPTPERPSGLTHFPPTLTLQDQGLFALGFYHQRAADRKAAQEARERKDAALADLIAPDDSDDDAENGTSEETEN